MQTLIYWMLGLPFGFVLVAVSGRVSNNVLHILNRVVATAVGGFFLEMLLLMQPGEVFNSEYLYLDALSVWVLLIVIVLYVASAWVSKSYLIREHKRGYLCRTPKLIGRYYALFHLFVWTMMLVLMLKNLGLM